MISEIAKDADDTDAELYERVAPELIRFATALVGRVDAPDVLSGAVVKALASPGWPAVADRRAYLYRSVFNETQTWLRRAGQVRFSKPELFGPRLLTGGSCPICDPTYRWRWRG